MVRMRGKIVKMLLVFGSAGLLLSGCVAVENQFLVKLPFFEAKSDKIPGLDPPHQRIKLIREKGAKGAKANEKEREILVAQLVYEYQTSPDSNMRREAVDALAKIQHPDRDRYLREILKDENPFVRISALEALGKTKSMYDSELKELTVLLLDRMKTDTDKDVRLVSVRILGDVSPKEKLVYKDPDMNELRQSVVLELGNLLQDKIPAVRYEAMQSLQKITGRDYGDDINRWVQYVRYVKGEVPELPSKRSLAEKMPTIALPMFK